MTSAILGKWELSESNNYDEYLKTVGVGMIKRKLAAAAKPVLIYTESGGKYTQRTESTLKSYEISFVLGVEFDEETADDRKAKSTITIDGNKLTHKQRIGEQESTTVREFNGSEMVSTFTSGTTVAVRKFKKIA